MRSNDLGLSCASNMVAPRSEVQAELCGPASLPRQLQTDGMDSSPEAAPKCQKVRGPEGQYDEGGAR